MFSCGRQEKSHNRSGELLPLVKNKECGYHDEYKADAVVPFEFVAEIKHGEHGKDRERNDFLNGLQLCGSELVRADAVRGHLETVLEERYPPADHDYFPERLAAEFQVAIPCNSHEDVGDREQQNSSHSKGRSSRVVVRLA